MPPGLRSVMALNLANGREYKYRGHLPRQLLIRTDSLLITELHSLLESLAGPYPIRSSNSFDSARLQDNMLHSYAYLPLLSFLRFVSARTRQAGAIVGVATFDDYETSRAEKFARTQALPQALVWISYLTQYLH